MKETDPDNKRMTDDAKERMLPWFREAPKEILETAIQNCIFGAFETLEAFVKAVESGDEGDRVKTFCELWRSKIMLSALMHCRWELYIEPIIKENEELQESTGNVMNAVGKDITKTIQNIIDQATSETNKGYV